jgi:hypothetical protein
MQALMPLPNICLNVNCDYVEVWCVPSATHVSFTDRNQYADLAIRGILTLLFRNQIVIIVSKLYFVRGVYGKPSGVAKTFWVVFLVPFQPIQ